MTTSDEQDATQSSDRLVITRDMMINDRRCALRIIVADGLASVTFEATEADGTQIGDLRGTLAVDDLIPVTRAINATLGSAAKALGLTKSKYTAELDEVRKSHPRAGLPWSAEEDAKLMERHRAGASLVDLSSEFERNIGGIASRLKLHGFRLPARHDHDTDDPNLDYADISEPDPGWI